MRLTIVAPIRKHQKKRTARWWFLWVISVWVVNVSPPGGEVVRHSLLAHLDDDLGVYAECREVRRQGADQHVPLAFDLADLRLSDAEVGRQLKLRQTACSAYRREVDPCLDTTLKNKLLLRNICGL